MKIAVVASPYTLKGDFDRIESPFSAEDILDYDIIIDFSPAEAVLDNIIMYCHLGICAIIASSEWLEYKDAILGLCSEDDIEIAYCDSLSSDLISLARDFYFKEDKLPFERLC